MISGSSKEARRASEGKKSTTGFRLTMPVFSFTRDDKKPRVVVALKDSKWSKPIGFDSPVADMAVQVSTSRGTELHAGLSYAEGTGKVRYPCISHDLLTDTPMITRGLEIVRTIGKCPS